MLDIPLKAGVFSTCPLLDRGRQARSEDGNGKVGWRGGNYISS